MVMLGDEEEEEYPGVLTLLTLVIKCYPATATTTATALPIIPGTFTTHSSCYYLLLLLLFSSSTPIRIFDGSW